MRKQSYPSAFYFAAAIAAMIGLLSACVNGWFGWETGKTVEVANVPYLGVITAGHGRALLSASSDLLKDFLSVLIIAALIAKGVQWWVRGLAVLACAALWVPLVVNSWTYASGAVALISSDTASVRSTEIEAKRRLTKDEARIEKMNRWTAEIESYRDTKPSAIDQEIEAHKLDLRWKTSAACKSANGESERSYCRKYHVLLSARETAEAQIEDHKELGKIKEKLAAMTAVPLVANPAAATLAKSLGTSEEDAIAFTSGLGALILEGVPTGLPAILYFFAVTILRPKEPEIPVVTKRAPRTRIALASGLGKAAEAVEKINKPGKSAFQKIEEGLTEALAVAKGEAQPVERIRSAPPPDDDPNAIIAAARASLPAGRVPFAAIMDAVVQAGGKAIDQRTVSAWLKRDKSVTRLENDRERVNGQRMTWYQIAGRPKLVGNLA